MTRQRFVTLALTFAVAGLPLSGIAQAQDRTSNGNTTGSAVPRSDGGGSASPRSDGGGSSAGGGSTSSGSSGGDSGGMGSGWSSQGSASFEPPRRSDEQGARSRSGGSSTGTAAPRGGASTSTRGGGNTSSGRNAAASGSNASDPNRRAVPAYSRPRDGRPVTGEAAERGSVPPAGGGGNYPVYPSYPYYPYYPWGFWGPGYGFGLGYLYYDPFFGGGYGYGYPGDYGYGAGGGSGGYSVSESHRDNGSLRLKINPRNAQIYIDGFYVGVVDSYDGAFQKLGLEGGSHKVELKADGYEPLQFDVLVTPGETATYKGEMKRIQ